MVPCSSSIHALVQLRAQCLCLVWGTAEFWLPWLHPWAFPTLPSLGRSRQHSSLSPAQGQEILQVSYMDPSTPRALAVAVLLLCLCHAGQPSDCWQPTSPRGGQNPSGRAGTSEEIAPNCSHRAWRKRFDGFTEENGWEGIDKHTERSN